MSAHDFAVAAARALREVIRPLEDAFLTTESANMLLLRHGWLPPADEDYVEALAERFAIAARLEAIVEPLEQIVGQPDPSASEVWAAVQAGLDFLEAIVGLVSSPVPPGLVGILGTAEFWSELPRDLYANLFADYLRIIHPVSFALLRLSGVITRTSIPAAGRPGRIDYTRTELRWSRLADLVSDPEGVARDEYGWQGPLDYRELFARLHESFAALGVTSSPVLARHAIVDSYYAPTNPSVSELRLLRTTLYRKRDPDGSTTDVGFLMLPIPAAADPAGPPVGLLVGPTVIGEGFAEIGLGGAFALQLAGGFESDVPVGIELRPGRVDVAGTGAGSGVAVSATLVAQPRDPWLLVGTRDSSRLEAAGATLSLLARGSATERELVLRLGTQRIRLVVDPGEADGFLSRILGEQPASLEGSAALVWSSRTGLSLEGSASLAVRIPINRTIGPVSLDEIRLAATTEDGHVAATAGVTGSVDIGPVTVIVDNVGVAASFVPRAAGEPRGSFGDLDVAMAFKPPDGLGVLVDAGPITGGGTLLYDAVDRRYSGALQLEVHDIALKAVGIVQTQLPGGREGYSFLISISTEFTPLPLGFGFTLDGVGGLIGLHRTIDVGALEAGLRRHTLDSVLFPENPVRDAVRILDTVDSFFPAAEGRHVFGPMAKIGWGTPQLLSAEVALILELPAPVRLALLGQLHAALPRPDDALVEIHVDILGAVDFSQKLLAIDAALRDSRVVSFPLTGDIAMRLAWGEPASFALALGGFNPHFRPPPGFPTLRRLTIDLGIDDPHISLDAYLAVTSNTLQVGAKAEVQAGGKWNIYGWLEFDALFMFSPFSFVIDVGGGVSLRRYERKIATIHFDGTISGPAPWHVWGEACISFFFFDVCVDVDFEVGQTRRIEASRIDPTPLLLEAVADSRSWEPIVASSRLAAVATSTRASASEGVLVDPGAGVALRQRVVPLNRRLARFGPKEPLGPGRYDVSAVTLGGAAPTDWRAIQDDFAPAQFEALTDDQKLSRPSFARMDSGIAIAGDAVTLGPALTRDVAYETLLLPREPLRPPLPLHALSLAHQLAMTERGAGARAPMLHTGPRKFTPPSIENAPPLRFDDIFVVASRTSLSARLDISGPATKEAAYRALAEHLGAHPDDHSELQIVPLSEVA